MNELEPVKLHDLIGAKTVWTDQLWKQSLRFVKAGSTLDETIEMAGFVGDSKVPYKTTKDQYLGAFHYYPLTTLLGAYDMLRRHRLAAEHVAEIGRTVHVEQRDLSRYSVEVEQRDLSHYRVQGDGDE